MKRYVFLGVFWVLFCSSLFGSESKLETIDFCVIETVGISDVVINATDSMVKPKMRFDIFKYKMLTAIDDPNKIIGKVEDLVARIVITKTAPTYSVGTIVSRMDGGGSKPNISDISKGMMCRKTTKATLKAEKKMVIVPGATHLFEEAGALEEVARLAADWFNGHLKPVIARG